MWRIISPADTIATKSFPAHTGISPLNSCRRLQETGKHPVHQQPFPSSDLQGAAVDPNSAQSVSTSVGVFFVCLFVCFYAEAHFPAEVKYLQPVESMRQDSVHRSCPKDPGR